MIASLEPRVATSAPALSIVIASVNGWESLRLTLDSIDRLPERDRIEVIVVNASSGEIARNLRRRTRSVEVVTPPSRLSIPRLRYLGVMRAEGDLVAILEDHAEVDPQWASALLEAHQGPWGAVGGTVENGQTGIVNWAAFFCEYTSYMGPIVEGETDDLPGNNIAYKRGDLLRHAEVLDLGNWESWINDRLRSEGVPIAATNRAVVRHIKPFRLLNFLVQRFHFARSYAGMRRVDQPWTKRLLYGFGSAILPAVLTLRVIRTALQKRRNLLPFVVCLPLIVLFFTVGSLGEMIGYLLGPGRSLDLVE